MNHVVRMEAIQGLIIELRGEQVLIDADVARLYGVVTRDINKAVGNNPDKFPDGYVIELSKEEKKQLVENFHRFDRLKHSSAIPKAFTEKGLYMLATILKSKQAKNRREEGEIRRGTKIFLPHRAQGRRKFIRRWTQSRADGEFFDHLSSLIYRRRNDCRKGIDC